jgi:cytochrome c oxidase subunit III
MTPIFTDEATHIDHAPPPVQNIDPTRGTYGMLLFILTEAMLFVFMFFGYYYVAKGNERWQIEEPPSINYSIPMLGVITLACVVLWWGQRRAVERKALSARLALVAAIILGLGYLALGYFDDSSHLLHVTPQDSAYGSTFYTITTLHAGHVILGILMLFWVLAFPKSKWEPVDRPPHRPYYNVLIYWYFLAVIWLATVAILYVGPLVYNKL